eukprot:Filipodium_phascolosomae@DN780_c0_g1_i1.p1
MAQSYYLNSLQDCSSVWPPTDPTMPSFPPPSLLHLGAPHVLGDKFYLAMQHPSSAKRFFDQNSSIVDIPLASDGSSPFVDERLTSWQTVLNAAEECYYDSCGVTHQQPLDCLGLGQHPEEPLDGAGLGNAFGVATACLELDKVPQRVGLQHLKRGMAGHGTSPPVANIGIGHTSDSEESRRSVSEEYLSSTINGNVGGPLAMSTLLGRAVGNVNGLITIGGVDITSNGTVGPRMASRRMLPTDDYYVARSGPSPQILIQPGIPNNVVNPSSNGSLGEGGHSNIPLREFITSRLGMDACVADQFEEEGFDEVEMLMLAAENHTVLSTFEFLADNTRMLLQKKLDELRVREKMAPRLRSPADEDRNKKALNPDAPVFVPGSITKSHQMTPHHIHSRAMGMAEPLVTGVPPPPPPPPNVLPAGLASIAVTDVNEFNATLLTAAAAALAAPRIITSPHHIHPATQTQQFHFLHQVNPQFHLVNVPHNSLKSGYLPTKGSGAPMMTSSPNPALVIKSENSGGRHEEV